jgi:catechol-2,3-dioxygenase
MKTLPQTLGAAALKDLVLDAAYRDVEETVDMTGIVWLEHINLVVGSRQLAERFYFDLLGFSKDKSPSFHCNLGQQQFHLAANGDPAQRVTGSIGLVVPSLETLRQRVDSVIEDLKETQFEIVQDAGDTMTVICPWGNRLHLYDAEQENQQLEPTSDSPQKMVKQHADGGAYGANRMAVRGQPGIRYIEITCRPGTTSAICQFYQEMIGCSVSKPNKGQAVICIGPGVHLAYIEDESLKDLDIQAMEGVHLCVYAHDFKGLHDRLKAKDLIWTNPRFVHLDTCNTWEEAMISRTLRFKDIVDLSTGEKVAELEHETRPLRHGQFLKVPYYEPK